MILSRENQFNQLCSGQKGLNSNAWIENADGNIVKLGTLKVEKAGFLLDYISRVSLTGELTIIVSKETKNDNFLEKTLLEGALSL